MRKITILSLLISFVHISYGQLRASMEQRASSPDRSIRTPMNTAPPVGNSSINNPMSSSRQSAVEMQTAPNNSVRDLYTGNDMSYKQQEGMERGVFHSPSLHNNPYGQHWDRFTLDRSNTHTYHKYNTNPDIRKDASGITFYTYSFADKRPLIGDKYALSNIEIATLETQSLHNSNAYILIEDDEDVPNIPKGGIIVGYKKACTGSHNTQHSGVCSEEHDSRFICELTGLSIGHARGYFCRGCVGDGVYWRHFTSPCMKYLNEEMRAAKSYKEVLDRVEAYFICVRNYMQVQY